MELRYAEDMALVLMDMHGLLEAGWSFKFNGRFKRMNARCSYDIKLIELSKNSTQVNDVVVVKNTIIHEIAHALVGPGHGHDSVWQAKFLAIGGNGEKYGKFDDSCPKAAGYKYVLKTPAGKVIKGWFRRPQPQTFAKAQYFYEKGNKAATFGRCRIVEV